MNLPLRNDHKLLTQCFSGHKKAQERFVRNFSNLVYRTIQHTFILKHLPFTYADLEDLHNTVFLMLFENQCNKLRQYRGKNGCSLATWIRIVTIRIVLNQFRKKGIDSIAWQYNRIAFEDIPELKEDAPGPLAKMEEAERKQLIEKGIRNLPSRDRLFLMLHFEKGFSIKEVAETMQLSIDNAYTIKHRAVQKLKSQIGKTK